MGSFLPWCGNPHLWAFESGWDSLGAGTPEGGFVPQPRLYHFPYCPFLSILGFFGQSCVALPLPNGQGLGRGGLNGWFVPRTAAPDSLTEPMTGTTMGQQRDSNGTTTRNGGQVLRLVFRGTPAHRKEKRGQDSPNTTLGYVWSDTTHSWEMASPDPPSDTRHLWTSREPDRKPSPGRGFN